MFIFSLHIGHYIALNFYCIFYCTIVRLSLSSLKATVLDLTWNRKFGYGTARTECNYM